MIQLVPFLAYLKDRWEDEKGYEDIIMYTHAIDKAMEERGMTFVDLTTKPFRVTFCFNSKRYQITIKEGEAQLMQLPIAGDIQVWNN